MKNARVVCVLAAILVVTGCAKKSDDEESSSGAVAAAGVATMTGSVNNVLSGSTSAMLEKRSTSVAARLFEAFLPTEALATSCSTMPYQESCSSGVKTATYSACPIGSTGMTYDGAVVLTFGSQVNCLAGTLPVTRTVSLTRTGFFGSTITTSSASHTDYRGNTISGGTTLSGSGGNYTLSIGGVRKVRTNSAGSTVYNISVRTTSDISVNDSSGVVTISGGALEVIHNIAQYVATFSASNVQYNRTTCCYPTSGTIAVTYSGAVSGTASISFPSCGTMTFSKDGDSASVSLPGCE